MTMIRKGILIAMVSLGVFQLLGMEEDRDSEGDIIQTPKEHDEVPSLSNYYEVPSLFELCYDFVFKNYLLSEETVRKLPLNLVRRLIKLLIEEKLYPVIENLLSLAKIGFSGHGLIRSVHKINTQEGLRIIPHSNDGILHVWKLENNKLLQVVQGGSRSTDWVGLVPIIDTQGELLIITSFLNIDKSHIHTVPS